MKADLDSFRLKIPVLSKRNYVRAKLYDWPWREFSYPLGIQIHSSTHKLSSREGLSSGMSCFSAGGVS